MSFRERILVDGVPIREDAVAMWTERLRPLILEREGHLLRGHHRMAFADFAARGAEVAVIEVGLGGRLDSTNVVRPLVSAVTKIAPDHMKYLGDTLEQIAREKAGIAKPGAPFVIGETDPALVEVLRREARRAVARAAPGDRGATSGCCRRSTRGRGPLGLAGPAPAAERGGRPRHPDGAAGALPARPGRSGARLRRAPAIAGSARPAGPLAVRRGPQPRRRARAGRARSSALGPPRPLHALVSILGDKDWPEMLVRARPGASTAAC